MSTSLLMRYHYPGSFYVRSQQFHNTISTVSFYFGSLSYTVCIRGMSICRCRWWDATKRPLRCSSTKLQSKQRSLVSRSCSRPIKIELIERRSQTKKNSIVEKYKKFKLSNVISVSNSLSSPVCVVCLRELVIIAPYVALTRLNRRPSSTHKMPSKMLFS